MKRTGRKQEWSLALFAVGLLLFFPPLIALFDKPDLVLGVPLSYLVLFGVWSTIISGIWLGARPARSRGDTVPSNDKGDGALDFGHVRGDDGALDGGRG